MCMKPAGTLLLAEVSPISARLCSKMILKEGSHSAELILAVLMSEVRNHLRIERVL
jgi:hypothetical protein